MPSTGARSTSDPDVTGPMAEWRNCRVCNLGTVPYARALELQLQIVERKKRGFEDDALLLLNHPPTITLGRNGTWQNLLAAEGDLRERGIERFEVDRGGDITFHGPGQLVAYPILALGRGERDVRRFMRTLEEVMIRTLGRHGVAAHRIDGVTGVWTDRGKIGALGVHISRWITRHGIALNVNTDLEYFRLIVPCGLRDKTVTSMRELLGREVDLTAVGRVYVDEFGAAMNRRMLWVDGADLVAEAPDAQTILI